MTPSEPIARRRLLQVAIVSVLGACSSRRPRRVPPTLPAPPGTTTSTTSSPIAVADAGRRVDDLILRTASSLEHYAVGIYTEVAGLDVADRSGLVGLLTTFAGHHSDHAAALEQATLSAGGRPYTQPNRALSASAMRRLPGLRTADDLLEFVYEVEALSAATHRGSVGLFEDATRNSLIMGIGAVEARHMAVLGTRLVASSHGQDSAWPPWPAFGLPDSSVGLQPGSGL